MLPPPLPFSLLPPPPLSFLLLIHLLYHRRCCLLPFLIPASKLSVKQSGKAGGWPTFLPIEADRYSAVRSSRCPVIPFSAPLRHPQPTPSQAH